MKFAGETDWRTPGRVAGFRVVKRGEMELEVSAQSVALIPVITALVQVAKQMGMPSRYAPIPALVLGIAAGVLYVSPSDIGDGVLIGVVLGLSSMGAYEGIDHGTRPFRKPTT
jgi:uncharacterized membrane protein YGL010W